MAEKKKGFFDRLFSGKNQHDKKSPDEGVHRRPDETPSDQVPAGGAKSLQPGTNREPHAATVEEDSEAGAPEFLNETDKLGEGEDEEKPASTAPARAGDEESPPESRAAGEPEGGAAEEPRLPEPEPEPAPPLAAEPTPAAETALEEPAPPPTPEPEPKKRGLFGRLAAGMSKSSARLSEGLADAFVQKRELTDEALEALEDSLIAADLGLPAATRVITELSKTRYKQDVTLDEVRAVLATEVARTLKPLEAPLSIDKGNAPHVILVAGVNGAGKTTTIGKLAAKLKAEGHSVLLAAGDTFRAAAIEQLQVWGERTDTPVVTRPQGADAAGLAYDAVEQARREGIDVVLIDTAGRLQNRSELMDELSKVVRVIRKLDETAPHDSLLVLDATVGQNALRQAEAFTETAHTTGLVMTKLDGTARGGVLVALADRFGLPIHYIGVGEQVDDLQPFDASAFSRALTAETTAA
ncbi:signal recognition particle-docking protein FtsY [Parvularcula oceani]|uniref:signal recognition particle-docking protein FtsY n=1 Tax=Parvularcula oceani TaxID=1247963 RepID=UPI0004E11FFA|nr:signal recognition particle-docking protein FtsY [Parvularcula oceani]